MTAFAFQEPKPNLIAPKFDYFILFAFFKSFPQQKLARSNGEVAQQNPFACVYVSRFKIFIFINSHSCSSCPISFDLLWVATDLRYQKEALTRPHHSRPPKSIPPNPSSPFLPPKWEPCSVMFWLAVWDTQVVFVSEIPPPNIGFAGFTNS